MEFDLLSSSVIIVRSAIRFSEFSQRLNFLFKVIKLRTFLKIQKCFVY